MPGLVEEHIGVGKNSLMGDEEILFHSLRSAKVKKTTATLMRYLGSLRPVTALE